MRNKSDTVFWTVWEEKRRREREQKKKTTNYNNADTANFLLFTSICYIFYHSYAHCTDWFLFFSMANVSHRNVCVCALPANMFIMLLFIWLRRTRVVFCFPFFAFHCSNSFYSQFIVDLWRLCKINSNQIIEQININTLFFSFIHFFSFFLTLRLCLLSITYASYPLHIFSLSIWLNFVTYTNTHTKYNRI